VNKVVISRDHTALILDHRGKNERVESRIRAIHARLKKQPPLADKKVLEERLARLNGKAAVIMMGAHTRSELREKKARADDALTAAKAALEEGVIPGGGVAYIRTQQHLQSLLVSNADQQTGIRIILKALEEPLKRILANAGLEPAAIIQQVKEGKEAWGFNAQSLQFEDLVQAGILDTVKVARIALESAASIAGAFLTLECAIAEEVK